MNKTNKNGNVQFGKKIIKKLNDIGIKIGSEVNSNELENLLCNDDDSVRIAIAECPDFKVNKDQIERGLTDDSEDVRAAFAGRKDYKPTAKQLERGLTDKFQIVRYAFYHRPDVTLSEMQESRAKMGSFNIDSPTSMEEHDEPDVICPFCKTWIIPDSDTWCKHLAYAYAPQFFEGLERGPAASIVYEKWFEDIGADCDDCSRRKFNLLCKNFQFKKRNVPCEKTMGYECGNITYAFTESMIEGDEQ